MGRQVGNRQIFLRRGRGKGDGNPHLLFAEARKTSNVCSTESPSARDANTVRNVTRVPRKTGSPPQIDGSRTIHSSGFMNPS